MQALKAEGDAWALQQRLNAITTLVGADSKSKPKKDGTAAQE